MLNCFTRDQQTQCKGVVENADVCFCSENSGNKLDLGNEYEEAGKEGKDCCQHLHLHLHLTIK